MLALPPAPLPARPRLMLLGTGLACGGLVMLFASMLAVYLSVREQGGGTTATWFPDGVVVPETATNVMLVGMLGMVVVAQWAVYALARDDRRNAGYALGLVVIFAAAIINAQIYTWTQMGVGIQDSPMGPLFYAITGSFVAAMVGGLVMGAIATFRVLGGRYTAKRHEGVAATALVIYTLALVFSGVWFVVYVWK